MKKLRYLMFSSLLFIIFSNLLGCSDDPINIGNYTTVITHKKAKIEYDYEGAAGTFWFQPFTDHSIPSDRAFYTEINVSDSVVVIYRNAFIYGTVQEGDILCYLSDTTIHNRSSNSNQWPFYLCLSWNLYTDNYGNTIMGLSNYLTNPDCGINWSYTFSNNIVQYSNTWNLYPHLTTLTQMVITHELGHQIARIKGDDAHIIHNGDINACVMWSPFTAQNRDSIAHDCANAYFCPRHVDLFMNGKSLSNWNQDYVEFSNNYTKKPLSQEEEKTAASQKQSNSNIKISLSNSEFKLYEPILVKFDYVNNHNTTDTIFFNFTENYSKAINFYVTSKDNKSLDKKIHSFDDFATVWEKPQFYIQPGDSFTVSMVLNRNNGVLVTDENYYLSNYGYYPEGEYNIFAEGIIGNNFVKTNELSFKVTGLSEEDKEVLNIIKVKDYKKVFLNFPANPFAEHAFSLYCTNQVYPVETWDNDFGLIFDAFGTFWAAYPNSFYNLNIGFVNSYFMKITNKTIDIDDAFSKVHPFSHETLFDKFINQKAAKRKLEEDFKILKDILNKSKSK